LVLTVISSCKYRVSFGSATEPAQNLGWSRLAAERKIDSRKPRAIEALGFSEDLVEHEAMDNANEFVSKEWRVRLKQRK